MNEWLRAHNRGHLAAQRQAWKWVERADETQLRTENYDDPRDVWHREILQPASEGRTEVFAEFVATSCQFDGLPGIDT